MSDFDRSKSDDEFIFPQCFEEEIEEDISKYSIIPKIEELREVLIRQIGVLDDDTFSFSFPTQTALTLSLNSDQQSKPWLCSLILSVYLKENDHLVEGKSVLEVGCGIALPSFSCFLLNSSSQTLTDQVYDK